MIDLEYTLDYQVHSDRSHDGLCTIHNHCLHAVEIGLDEIGFTEHKDFDPADPVVNYFDYDLYSREIEKARSDFRGSLIIRKGVEIDYQRWFEDSIGKYLETHSFDFILGSVHHIDRVMVMSPEYLASRDKLQAHRHYFDAVLDSANSGFFDILGHLEYANRRGVPHFGAYDSELFTPELREIFKSMRNQNVVLEINSAGLRYASGGAYPCLKTVQLYANSGGTCVTFGSDAHEPKYLAADFIETREIARQAGIAHLAQFSNRVRTLLPITNKKLP